MYTDDDLLAISKLNHFCYCKHRWAIGELKQEWADNYFTTYGHLEHQKTDNPFIKEKRNDIIISRAVRVVSQTHAAKEAPDFNRGEELANNVGKINAHYSL